VTDEAPIVDIIHDDELYRRLLPWYVITTDAGLLRTSSAAFRVDSKKSRSPNCSVYLARLTTPTAVLSEEAGGRPGQRVGQIQASVPIGLGLGVQHTPTSRIAGSVGYAHCEISGMAPEHPAILAAHCVIL
jgi:hypothetical protein